MQVREFWGAQAASLRSPESDRSDSAQRFSDEWQAKRNQSSPGAVSPFSKSMSAKRNRGTEG
jgi:hypothetical protein